MKRLYGLIGFPLGHSWSPAFFRKKFLGQGLENYDYQLFPLECLDEFSSLIEHTPSLCGLNVTIPHKESVIAYLDTIDPIAREIGAVNTVLVQRSAGEIKLSGYNTDSAGFIGSADFSGHKSALVLGAGGAARAVMYSLKQMGITFTLVSRSPSGKNAIGYGALNEGVVENNTLIINTTPLGMYPNEESAPPIPFHLISSRHFMYDLVYNPKETLFLKRGKEQGARVQSGLTMLHLQAELALELFLDSGS